MSTSTEYMAGMNAPTERRFYPRITPPTPIYVAFGPSNLGVLHNVSENGFQVTTPESLPVNSVFKVFVTLTGASKAINVSVRTIWTEETQKRSGIQLLDLTEQDRQHIRDWVELETSRNENVAPNGWFPPNRVKERPVVSPVVHDFPQQTFSQQAAPPSQRAKDSVEPPSPTVAPSQQAPAAQTEPDPYANLFAAATNPEEFPPVPLPIHHDFVYEPPAESTRGRSHRGTYARLRKKPLLMWAAVLAIVCLGADVLVKQKIAMNSRRYATDSQQKGNSAPAQPISDQSAPVASADNSPAAAPTDPSDDSNSGNASPAAASSVASSDTKSGQSTDALDHVRSSTAADSALTAQTKPSPKSASPRSQASTLDSETAQSARTGDSDSTAQASSAATSDTARRERLREYLAATAAPAATENEQPNVTRAANSNAASAPAQPPAATQPHPAPTTPTPSASSATVSAANTTPTPSSSPAAPVRTQAPPPVVNSQPPAQVSNPRANTTVAANQPPNNPPPTRPAANATNSNPSAIYNANGNAPAQKSAILGSINSVRSSGIFASANSPNAPPPVSPDPSPSTAPTRSSSSASNSYVATRTAPVNSGAIQTDSQPSGDIQISAPKGFTASYVEIPGERTVRSPSTTIHIQRLVRVPGERVPGQRWLWRGHMNVTLGELITRVDPSVAQAAATSGSLTVEASIDKDGYVTDLKPLYGNFAMLPAVSRAVRSWRYQPTYLDDKRAETQAKIEFDLHPPTASNRAARP